MKSAFFAKWSNAPVYGLDKYSAREAWAARFYAKKFAVKKGEDAIWRNRQLFAQVFDYSFEHTPDFGVNISGSLNDLPENYHVVLHATSRDSKLWQFNNWLNLLNKIHEVDNLPIILPWGNPTEYNRAQNIAAQLDFAVVGPKLTLFQAAQLLANAKSVIGVDTGLLHLANAVNRPLVGIYTDSDPMKTGVQPSDWAVNLGGIGQMPSVEDVFAAQQKCIQNFQAA